MFGRSKNRFILKPIHYKPRPIKTHCGSLRDDDYTPAPTTTETQWATQTETIKESIELNPENEEEKDKDYYFVDTSLLG
jgi:hypothetical protein